MTTNRTVAGARRVTHASPVYRIKKQRAIEASENILRFAVEHGYSDIEGSIEDVRSYIFGLELERRSLLEFIASIYHGPDGIAVPSERVKFMDERARAYREEFEGSEE